MTDNKTKNVSKNRWAGGMVFLFGGAILALLLFAQKELNKKVQNNKPIANTQQLVKPIITNNPFEPAPLDANQQAQIDAAQHVEQAPVNTIADLSAEATQNQINETDTHLSAGDNNNIAKTNEDGNLALDIATEQKLLDAQRQQRLQAVQAQEEKTKAFIAQQQAAEKEAAAKATHEQTAKQKLITNKQAEKLAEKTAVNTTTNTTKATETKVVDNKNLENKAAYNKISNNKTAQQSSSSTKAAHTTTPKTTNTVAVAKQPANNKVNNQANNQTDTPVALVANKNTKTANPLPQSNNTAKPTTAVNNQKTMAKNELVQSATAANHIVAATNKTISSAKNTTNSGINNKAAVTATTTNPKITATAQTTKILQPTVDAAKTATQIAHDAELEKLKAAKLVEQKRLATSNVTASAASQSTTKSNAGSANGTKQNSLATQASPLTVPAKSTAQALANNDKWLVQVAIAKDKARADELVSRLRAKGYHVKTSQTDIGVRVTVVPTSTTKTAQQIKNDINGDASIGVKEAWLMAVK